jgi:hypothetical protein
MPLVVHDQNICTTCTAQTNMTNDDSQGAGKRKEQTQQVAIFPETVLVSYRTNEQRVILQLFLSLPSASTCIVGIQ